MRRAGLGVALGCLAVLLGGPAARAADVDYTRTRDVIYGRKFGLALTMDVFTPKKANGKGLIWVVSGGWFSGPQAITPLFAAPFLKRGYTVFAVVHGSQPKFTIIEILDDMNRAVRFLRGNAERFKIDPEQLGVYGASAGGHLSLMVGTAGTRGDPKALDPIDRLSSRVRAVACFFPPTDFLNYGSKGKELIDRALRPPFTAAVDYHEYDRKTARYVPIKDPRRLREIARQVSPIYHVTADSGATLLIHGDKDELVPLQQSESMLAKLKEGGVPAELIVRKDAGHGWPTLLADLEKCADWFDKYLKKPKAEK